MPQMVYYMIKTVVGFQEINVYALREFILTVRKCYRPNPYHNWEHAFNVAHCMYNILLRNKSLFTIVEVHVLLYVQTLYTNAYFSDKSSNCSLPMP